MLPAIWQALFAKCCAGTGPPHIEKSKKRAPDQTVQGAGDYANTMVPKSCRRWKSGVSQDKGDQARKWGA